MDQVPGQVCYHADMTTAHQPPSLWKSLGESRAAFEWGASFLPDMRHAHGDGHPVLLLPGFLTTDLAMAPLRHRLERWGYDARPWELGLNLGPRCGTIAAIRRRVCSIHAETGRSVTLLGWSMGGSLAVAAARGLSSEVRSLITLGAPVQASETISRASALFAVVSGHAPSSPSLRRWLAAPPRQPWTAIVTRHDGVVSAQACVPRQGPAREAVWVPSTHLGMPANPCVLHVIASRLAQKEGFWTPFRVDTAPWFLRAAWALA